MTLHDEIYSEAAKQEAEEAKNGGVFTIWDAALLGARVALQRVAGLACSCDFAPCPHEDSRENARRLLAEVTD